MFLRSDRIIHALGQLADEPHDAVSPIIAVFPVRGGGLSIHQLVELNGWYVAATQFSWEENAAGNHLMARSMFPRLSNKWVGQGTMPASCFREVAEQYSPDARITHMEVRGDDTIGVYVLNADGERRLDRHRFKLGLFDRWERIPHGGE